MEECGHFDVLIFEVEIDNSICHFTIIYFHSMQTLISNIGQLLGIREDQKKVLRGKELNELKGLSNAWLLINDGIIADYGLMTDLEDISNVKKIDANGGLVFPGFCDSHTHLVYAETREGEFEDRIRGLTYEEVAARGGGILNSVEKLRTLSEDELYERSYARCLEVLRMGTTSIEIKSGYGLNLESELKMLRVARRLNEELPLNVKTSLLAAHAFPPEFADDHEGYVNHICKHIIPAAASEGVADYIDVFCERGYFNSEQTDRILACGGEHGMRPKVHVNQFSSCGGVQVSIKHGALSIDHLEVMKDFDLRDVVESDTIATALPACSFFLTIPYTPGREIIDNDGLLALATDYNPGSSPNGNMAFVMSLACIKMNMTPQEALNASTLNGAAAMELSEVTGSITRGKRADLIVTQPMKNLAQVPYHFGSNSISMVFAAGISVRSS